MKTRKATTVRNLLTSALVGLALVAMPGTARADFLDFDVDEGTVPGANDVLIEDVDKLNGAYTEHLSIAADGTFTTSAYATFTQYLENEGTDNVGSQLGSSVTDLNQYLIYALFTSTGTAAPIAPGVLSFTGVTGFAELFIDPLSDTTLSFVGTVATASAGTADDYKILVATSLLNPGSGGVLSVSPVLAGGFSLIFTDPTLTTCVGPSELCGEAYWPTLVSLELRANVTGDFDSVFSPIGPGTSGFITGDVSNVFQATPIPEPATLMLFGLGAAALARRRAKAARKN